MKILSLDVPGGRIGGYATLDSDFAVSIGSIIFSQEKSLADDFRTLAALIDTIKPTLVIVERPFLFQIAGYIGAVLGFCSERHTPWWQVGPSRAKKLVLGRGNAKKVDVLQWACQTYGTLTNPPGTMTQHQADALLYLEAWRKSVQTASGTY